MSQTRTSTKSKKSRTSGEEFVLIVHHIPPTYRWQELKDLLRSYGLQSFKQSHTDRFENDGTFYGSIAIIGRADAYLAYDNLVRQGWNGHRVQVSLLDSSKVKVRGPEFSPLWPQSQAGAVLTGVPTRIQSTPNSYSRLPAQMAQVQLNSAQAFTYPTSVMSSAAPLGLGRPSTAVPQSAYAGTSHARCQAYDNGGRDHVLAVSQSHRIGSHPLRPSPVHDGSPPYSHATASSARSRHSGARTGKYPRTLRVAEISSATSANQFTKFMDKFGNIRAACMPLYEYRGRWAAVVEYSKCEEALSAFNYLTAHGDRTGWKVEFASVEIVREKGSQRAPSSRQGSARDHRPSASSGPLVVNGARGSVGRRGSHDDSSDSDNTDDESDQSRSRSTESNEDRHNRRRIGSRCSSSTRG